MRDKGLTLFAAMALISVFTFGSAFSQDSPVQTPCDSAQTAMHCEKKADSSCCQGVHEARCKAAMTCPVSGKPASKEFFSEYKGKKVFFCCAKCKAAFDLDPEKYAARIHACGDSCKKHEGKRKGGCGKGEGMQQGCNAATTCPDSGNPASK